MRVTHDTELELQRDLYRQSYYEFFKDAVVQLEPDTYWEFNWHIEEACNIFQQAVERVVRKEAKPYDLSFNLPPSSSKSMIFSVCSIAWIWTFAPHVRLATDSYKRALSTDHCRKTSRLINTTWYQDLYGSQYKLVKSTEERIENDKGGLRVAYVDTGFHYDIIIGDDLLDAQGGASEAEVKAADDFWFKTVPSRFRSQIYGLKVLVMQRLAQNDPCGIVKERKLNYRQFVVPAILTKDLTPYDQFKHKYGEDGKGTFWPQRFPMNIIQDKQKEMSEADFASQYLQSPSPPEGGMVKRDWIEVIEPNAIIRDPIDEPIHFFCDTAYTDKHENDPNAFLACFKRKGDIYIINVHEEWLTITQHISYLQQYVQANRYSNGSLIYIEPKASGKDIVDVVKNQTGLKVVEAKNPIKDKRARLNAAIPFIRSGRVKFIKGAYLEPFLSQLCMQPFASRWDMTDCLSMAVDELLMGSDFDFLLM